MRSIVTLCSVALLALLIGACSDSSDRQSTPPLDEDTAAGADTSGGGDDTVGGSDTPAPPSDVQGIDTTPGDDVSELDTSSPGDVVLPPCCGPDDPCPEGYLCTGPGGLCKLPAEGDACWSDEECDEPTVCVGAFTCPCAADCSIADEPGTCMELPYGCCKTSDDCDDGLACYGVEYSGDYSGLGVCKTTGTEASCWGDEDCPEGATCQGASFCGCGLDCFMADMPGTCVETIEGCCQTDAQCDEGLGCYFVGGDDPNGGSCLEPPDFGSCWDDTDCTEYGECVGASACPCGTICGMLQGPGVCEPLFDGCCNEDTDCAEGYVCATPEGMLFGGCHPDPAGQLCDGEPCCWMDDDCGTGEYCKGAGFCGCLGPWDGDCAQAVMGQCVPSWPLCCEHDVDCPSGTECVQTVLGQGVCKEPAPDGTCWHDANCGDDAVCVGESLCPCDAMCDEMDLPGTCELLADGCCKADYNCEAGTVCEAVTPESIPGSCVPDPNGPECLGDVACCWKDADCPGGDICIGESVCGCVEMCPYCGACLPDQMGYCGTTYEYGCCVDGYQCSEGQVCFGGLVGAAGSPTCLPVPDEGRCWSSDDCGASEECAGSAYCPCDMDCDMMYVGPGVCKPMGIPCADMTGIDFGVCAAELGWVLKGSECVLISGCGSMQFAEFVYDTQAECESLCNLYD